MDITIRDVRQLISKRFPERCAESWDNPGLQVGRNDAVVKKVLVALELTPSIVREAVETGVNLIVTHHPFIFRPIKKLNDDTPDGEMLLALAEHRIGMIAAHTNLDCAAGAITQKLADDLELANRRNFLEHHPYAAYKIVVFVPEKDAERVAEAMHESGAGCVGNYSNVSFCAKGKGRFTCGQESHPAIGEPGTSETVDEVRIEMVVSESRLSAVTKALRAAHPYEEPAYDVFMLESEVHGMTDAYSFGVSGTLPEPVRLDEFIPRVKKVWDISSLRAAGRDEKMISRVAILNGAGAKYLSDCRGIDAFITGDCGHHDFDNAIRRDIALIDAGHYDTEKYIPQILADMISTEFRTVETRIASTMCNPFKTW